MPSQGIFQEKGIAPEELIKQDIALRIAEAINEANELLVSLEIYKNLEDSEAGKKKLGYAILRFKSFFLSLFQATQPFIPSKYYYKYKKLLLDEGIKADYEYGKKILLEFNAYLRLLKEIGIYNIMKMTLKPEKAFTDSI